MPPIFYKIFFIALLMIGGFLLLGNVNEVFAVDACGGVCSSVGPGYYCDPNGAGMGIAECVQENNESETDACGGVCPDGYYCNPVGAEDGSAACENGTSEETDACGGMCLGTDVCNEATGECVGPENPDGDSPGGGDASCVDSCAGDPACEMGCTGGAAGGGLPGAGSGLPGAGAASGGAGSVQLPNFLGSGVTSIKDLILRVVAFLIDLAKYFAALMLVWAGFLFVTAQGDPAKLTKAKQNLLWTVAGIAVILASDAIVTYIMEVLGVTGAGAGSALLNKIKATLTEVVALLFILVTLYFFWGIAEFVRASSSGDSAKLEAGKKHMVWGIIGMAVMAGAWGIVEMIRVFFL